MIADHWLRTCISSLTVFSSFFKKIIYNELRTLVEQMLHALKKKPKPFNSIVVN